MAKKQQVSEIVFKEIEQKIFSGEWSPGTQIMSEPQLAKELNVSRMSVREAIEKLVVLGILTKRHGEGTFVNQLTPAIYLNSLIPMITLDLDHYKEILEFRLITEVESARLCAQLRSPETMTELENCYHKMVQYQEENEKFGQADLSFHLLIAEGTHNSLMIKVSKVLKSLLEFHQKELYKNLGPSGGLKDHKRILEAIREQDGELAALFMRRHIERTIHDLNELPQE